MKSYKGIKLFALSLAVFVGCENEKLSKNTGSTDGVKQEVDASQASEEAKGKVRKSNSESNKSLSWPKSCYSQSIPKIEAVTKYNEKDIFYSQLSLRDRFEYSQLQVISYKAKKDYITNLIARFQLEGDALDLQSNIKVGSLDEIVERKIDISEAEAEKFYQDNKDGFPPNSNFNTMKPTIISLMKNQKKRSILNEAREQVQSQGGFFDYLEPPCLPKLFLNISNSASVAEKQNHIVYKGGFFCKECRVSWPKLSRVIKDNATKISFDFIPHLTEKTNPVEEYIAQVVQCVKNEKKTQEHLVALQIAFTTPIQFQNDLESAKKYVNDRLLDGLGLISKEKLSSCIETQQTKDHIESSKLLSKDIPKTDLLFVNDREFLLKEDIVSELSSILN